MVKEPRAGRVKTRLGREIGMVPAAWWFRHQVGALLRRLRDRRWRVVLAVSPDQAVSSRAWPADLLRLAQGRGDLGRRMARCLGAVGSGPVCLIGGDVPGVTRAAIWRGFAALGTHDAVFGPAEDGGFWLVGLRNGSQVPGGLFRGARFSTEHALADSVASLCGARVALVDRLHDVDTADDLKRAEGALPPAPAAPPGVYRAR
ncbi:TIGR04282 family arsenosugar biosynthesis glycosyltransferase [Thetidibacter halocola]|uniref:DUF2064 domain-containing protein n=1 Tax=Thetidibacter halocola TaxID=2827239 RepID=A0A8J7WIC3_9RHOB|nr:DUF2064 domain-containing protein [Thetidibacter halocola]MBS0125858.1 DUF2064 domain-containing protein [Thetidibacter halocola]